MKETPWLRIRGQNSVDRILGDCWQLESQRAVFQRRQLQFSFTISISAQKQHSRILLRALPRGRMSENHREPEVPEAGVPVEECFDCLARITSKELAPIHSVRSGILQSACSTRPRVVADLVKSALICIARLMNSLAKGVKRIVTKVQCFF